MIQPTETAASTRDEVRSAIGLEENAFDCVSITVASPDTIRKWSKGEVKNPETINYRTFKPEPGGLFCQKIFGPVRDYECACGKYKRIKYKDVVCDRCGVEVTVARVRRERMGHIELAAPVAHIWFLKSMPSRLGLLLDMTARALERVIYYENLMVIDPGKTPLEPRQLLTDTEYRQAIDEYGDDSFTAKMGAEAVRDALAKMDMDATVAELQEQMRATRSKQIKKKLSKRLKVIQGFIHSKSRPEWMVLEVLPVIPPDLRPLVPLEGGRFATSDLNDLYRRVINRNNRLKNLMQLKTPDVIIHNEKRMLQESVDALFDNGRHGRPVTGAGNRPLKSLSDMLKGKQGRFRQNLLGKRVDYSGRSVIVIGPELKLHQCGLPKKMALVLFEPFIIRRLKELGFVHTVRGARKMIEKKSPEVWDILEEVTKGHPVLLNRAPTLHRLSIQAFEPILIEGEAIRIHPLVCTAYNADFDGDQMAVHVPLSLEAIMECKLLMMATSNIFSPSSGKPILTPSQDIVLGAYYLTIEPRKKPAKGERVPLLSGLQEVLYAKADGAFKMHDWVEIPNPDYGRDTVFGQKDRKTVRTTVGRVIFNQIWPVGLGFVNFAVPKSKLGDLILNTYKVAGDTVTIEMLDKLKELGFQTAFQAGISIGIDDMIIPESKKDIVADSRKKITEVEAQFNKGIITDGERYNKIVDIWTGATDRIAKEVFSKLEANDGRTEVNPVYIMMDSVRAATGSRCASSAAPAASWPSPPAKSSSARSCPRSARASPSSNTSSPRTARAKVWPTRPSRPQTPATSPASFATSLWTWSSATMIAARATASGRKPSSRVTTKSFPCASASSAVARATTFTTRSIPPSCSSVPASSSPRRSRTRSRIAAWSASKSCRRSPRPAASASIPRAMASTWPRTKSPRSATPSASSPRSPSASLARSSPCVPSTSVAWPPAASRRPRFASAPTASCVTVASAWCGRATRRASCSTKPARSRSSTPRTRNWKPTTSWSGRSCTSVTAKRLKKAPFSRNGILTTFPCCPKRVARSRSRT